MLSTLSIAALLPAFALAAPLKSRQSAGTQIQFGSNTGLCVTVTSATLFDGAPVGVIGCDPSFASTYQMWDLYSGDNVVRLHNTNFCLDAGSNPSNNIGAKIWTCYPGLFNQQWYFTGDNRIAITGGNQCLDLATSNNNFLQTYQCITGNTNQVWYSVGAGGSAPPTTTSVAPPTTSTTPVTNVVSQITFGGDSNVCITVLGGSYYDGAPVGLGACDLTFGSGNQLWNIQDGASAIQLAGTSFCLDAGLFPNNFGSLKIWTCIPGIFDQNWYYTNDDRIAITGGNQCLDLNIATSTLQTYQCTTGNTNQIWNTFVQGASPPVSTTSSVVPTSTSTSIVSTSTSSVSSASASASASASM